MAQLPQSRGAKRREIAELNSDRRESVLNDLLSSNLNFSDFMKDIEQQIYGRFAIPEKLIKNVPTSSATETEFKLNQGMPRMIGSILGGIKIIASTLCMTRQQYRFPRSKKKRMQKKWRKDQSNWREQPAMYMIGNGDVVAHPEIVRKIQHQIDSQLNERMAAAFR